MKTNTLADQLLAFYQYIQNYKFRLPRNIRPIQPYEQLVWKNLEAFFQSYYTDQKPRTLVIGINPGRKGAGVTGIPFTDSIRLKEIIHPFTQEDMYEPSADFFYKPIAAYGGPRKFYSNFLISSVSPVGFIHKNSLGNWTNYNYYDSKELFKRCTPFIKKSMGKMLQMPVNREVAICLGKGKNFKHLSELNHKFNWFDQIIPIEHPRYILQYKRKEVDHYIQQYLALYRSIKN